VLQPIFLDIPFAPVKTKTPIQYFFVCFIHTQVYIFMPYILSRNLAEQSRSGIVEDRNKFAKIGERR